MTPAGRPLSVLVVEDDPRLLGARVGNVMAILFIAAMSAYVGALVCFLREVFQAIDTMRFNLPPEVRRGGHEPHLAVQASSASGSGPARSGPTSP